MTSEEAEKKFRQIAALAKEVEDATELHTNDPRYLVSAMWIRSDARIALNSRGLQSGSQLDTM